MSNLKKAYTEADVFTNTQGLPTGYSSFDRETGGFHGGHLFVLAAESGAGKSIFAINVQLHLATHNHKSTYFDFENGSRATIKRYLMISLLKDKKFFDNPQNKEESEAVIDVLSETITYKNAIELEKFVKDKSGLAKAQAIAEVIKTEAELGSEFFILDPLSTFDPESTGEFNEQGRIVELFKNLAQELNVPILILHHLTKPADRTSQKVTDLNDEIKTIYRVPTIHDLIGSSKIANYSTDIIALVRQMHDPDMTSRGKILLRILKAREGVSQTDFKFVMNLSNLKITEPAFEMAQEVFGK